MPSLFSRSRTTSTPTPAKEHQTPSEFGVVGSPIRAATATTSKKKKGKDKDKDKDKDRDGKEAQRQFSSGLYGSYYSPGPAVPDSDVPPPLPDGSFLPTTGDQPARQTVLLPPNPLLVVPDSRRDTTYGFLSHKANIILSPTSLRKAVDAINEELVQRGGLTTPFIFNSSHLEITGVGKGLSRVKRCIDAFSETLRYESSVEEGEGTRERTLRTKAEADWKDELQFSGMHELGVVLRWTLARPIRISHKAGGEVRGLLDWDRYEEWRMRELHANFPPTHFPFLLSPPTSGLPQGAALASNPYPPLDKDLQRSILTVMSLLTRITANSASSGHTPPSLAALFGPLFFGLGPNLDTFPETYAAYLRSAHAMEHLLLSFIRWQDSPTASMSPNGQNIDLGSGSARSLGVPIRLKEWIKNYPVGLDTFGPDRESAVSQPRRGVRTIRVLSVRRNVRMYSPDLVKNASTWAAYRDPVSPQMSKKGISLPNTSYQLDGSSLSKTKEWIRICPYTRSPPLATEKDRMAPKYADAFKRRMALGRIAEPALGIPGGTTSTSSVNLGNNLSSSISSADSTSSYFGGSNLSRTGSSRTPSEETVPDFESLADLRWGNFESFGFGGGEDTQKKLEFDLNESSRQARVQRRETLSWNDFSTEGFSRGDGDLKSTLGFSTPVATSITSWPQQKEEMQRKLKKAQKALPPFGWSTEPVLGGEELVEEAFLDVFCDLIYGGGWADRERERGGEEGWLERECNWALVEYKSEPVPKPMVPPGGDPRTSSTVLLFEEFVPLEYRQQLAHHAVNKKRPRLQSLFASKETQNSKWKQAPTLNGKPYVLGATPSPTKAHYQIRREMEFEALLKENRNGVKMMSLSDLTSGTTAQTSQAPPQPHTPRKEKSGRFKLTGLGSSPEKREALPKIATPAGIDRKSLTPAEYSTVDFETRIAGSSESDEDLGNGAKRKNGKDDEDWVDILVGSQARRIGGQDALAPGSRRPRGEAIDVIQPTYEDPDQASQDVAQALAGVRNGSFSDDDTVGRRRRGGIIADDDEVDEIERVPRSRYVDTDYASTRDSDMYTDDAGDIYDQYQDDETDEDLRRSREVRARAQAAIHRARGGGGYFDQHPERRPDSLAPSDDASTQYTDDETYGQDDDDDGERTPAVSAKGAHLAAPLAPAPVYGLPSSPRPVDQSGSNSKTAALIEMYQEKDRQQASTASRIPVRGSSLEHTASPAGPRGPRSPTSPLTSPSPVVASPPAETAPSPESDLPQAPVIVPDRNTPSPARYVHGAPLHNVVEEEEEE